MTDVSENPNLYRVSSKFIIAKIAIGIGLFALIYSWGSDIYNQTFTQKTAAHVLGTLMLTGLFYFLTKTKTIKYDDIKCRLYVFNSKGQFEVEIPVEKIDKILFSAVGLGRGFYSYVLVYRDFQNQGKKVRLFPIPLKNDVDIIIADTKLRNPNLITRNWSFGINEFFD